MKPTRNLAMAPCQICHYCDFLREWTEYGINVYMKLQGENPGFIEAYVLRGRGDARKN